MNNEPQVIYARQRWTAEERAAERADARQELVFRASEITGKFVRSLYASNAIVLVAFALVLVFYRPSFATDLLGSALLFSINAVNVLILILALVRIFLLAWKARKHV